jgi:hypothetical protein
LGDAVFAQFGEQRAGEAGRVGRLQQRRHAAHGELRRGHRREVEAEVAQGFGVFLGGGDVERVGGKDGRE